MVPIVVFLEGVFVVLTGRMFKAVQTNSLFVLRKDKRIQVVRGESEAVSGIIPSDPVVASGIIFLDFLKRIFELGTNVVVSAHKKVYPVDQVKGVFGVGIENLFFRLV